MAQDAANGIAAAPLYRDLDAAEIADMAQGLVRRRFGVGDALMTQGEASDGAFVILSGQVSVSARLPGGGETAIADLVPGDLVGEMALLMKGGKRTATARAVTEVDALFTDRRYFDAALGQLRPASLKVLRRLGLIIADRLRSIRARARALVTAAGDPNLLRGAPTAGAPPSALFDVRAFLTILPSLQDFDAQDLDILYASGQAAAIPKGRILAEEGAMMDAPRLVIRGALMLAQRHGGRLHQLDILGPGRFAGVAPILEDQPAGAAILAAEDSVVFTFDSANFRTLWRAQDRMALHLLEAINDDLVLSLNTASNHLTRLTAQARVRALA